MFVSAALQAQLSTGSYNAGLILWYQIFSSGSFPRFAIEKVFTLGNYFLMLTGIYHFIKWLYPLRSTFIVINKYIFPSIFLKSNNSTQYFVCVCVTRRQKLTGICFRSLNWGCSVFGIILVNFKGFMLVLESCLMEF